MLIGLGLGAAGYSLQSGLYFAAIERLDVSMVALLLYTYPAFVTVAALLLGRATPTLRTWVALAIASAGLVLVLLAAGTGAFDLVGALLSLAASLTYTTYILVSDRIIGEIEPLALSMLVLTGATASFAVAGVVTGSLDLALSGEAWLWLVLIALVSTVVAVSAFFAGLRRVGPSEAAILSTFEPPVTVALAYLALGERLTWRNSSAARWCSPRWCCCSCGRARRRRRAGGCAGRKRQLRPGRAGGVPWAVSEGPSCLQVTGRPKDRTLPAPRPIPPP